MHNIVSEPYLHTKKIAHIVNKRVYFSQTKQYDATIIILYVLQIFFWPSMNVFQSLFLCCISWLEMAPYFNTKDGTIFQYQEWPYNSFTKWEVMRMQFGVWVSWPPVTARLYLVVTTPQLDGANLKFETGDNFIPYTREEFHVKNLLSFGHCPFGGGVKPMSKKIWTAFCGILWDWFPFVGNTP